MTDSVFLMEDYNRNYSVTSEDPINALQRSVDRVKSENFLIRQSHSADLVWVTGELRGILLSWGETEILNAVTKERVQHLLLALTEKIKED